MYDPVEAWEEAEKEKSSKNRSPESRTAATDQKKERSEDLTLDLPCFNWKTLVSKGRKSNVSSNSTLSDDVLLDLGSSDPHTPSVPQRVFDYEHGQSPQGVKSPVEMQSPVASEQTSRPPAAMMTFTFQSKVVTKSLSVTAVTNPSEERVSSSSDKWPQSEPSSQQFKSRWDISASEMTGGQSPAQPSQAHNLAHHPPNQSHIYPIQSSHPPAHQSPSPAHMYPKQAQNLAVQAHQAPSPAHMYPKQVHHPASQPHCPPTPTYQKTPGAAGSEQPRPAPPPYVPPNTWQASSVPSAHQYSPATYSPYMPNQTPFHPTSTQKQHISPPSAHSYTPSYSHNGPQQPHVSSINTSKPQTSRGQQLPKPMHVMYCFKQPDFTPPKKKTWCKPTVQKQPETPPSPVNSSPLNSMTNMQVPSVHQTSPSATPMTPLPTGTSPTQQQQYSYGQWGTPPAYYSPMMPYSPYPSATVYGPRVAQQQQQQQQQPGWQQQQSCAGVATSQQYAWPANYTNGTAAPAYDPRYAYPQQQPNQTTYSGGGYANWQQPTNKQPSGGSKLTHTPADRAGDQERSYTPPLSAKEKVASSWTRTSERKASSDDPSPRYAEPSRDRNSRTGEETIAAAKDVQTLKRKEKSEESLEKVEKKNGEKLKSEMVFMPKSKTEIASKHSKSEVKKASLEIKESRASPDSSDEKYSTKVEKESESKESAEQTESLASCLKKKKKKKKKKRDDEEEKREVSSEEEQDSESPTPEKAKKSVWGKKVNKKSPAKGKKKVAKKTLAKKKLKAKIDKKKSAELSNIGEEKSVPAEPNSVVVHKTKPKIGPRSKIGRDTATPPPLDAETCEDEPMDSVDGPPAPRAQAAVAEPASASPGQASGPQEEQTASTQEPLSYEAIIKDSHMAPPAELVADCTLDVPVAALKDFHELEEHSVSRAVWLRTHYFQSTEDPHDTHAACLLCSTRPLRHLLVSHYVRSHAEEEVLCARMSPQATRQAIIEEPLLPPTGETEGVVQLVCRMCQQQSSETDVVGFLDHCTAHTGEFRYRCELCNFRADRAHKIRVHGKSHGSPSANSGLLHVQPLPSECEVDLRVTAHVCGMCNYVQLSRERIVQHQTTEHPRVICDVLKVNLAHYRLMGEQRLCKVSPPQRQRHARDSCVSLPPLTEPIHDQHKGTKDDENGTIKLPAKPIVEKKRGRQAATSGNKRCTKRRHDDAQCPGCRKWFYDDVVPVNWLQCLGCDTWVHESCTEFGNHCNKCG